MSKKETKKKKILIITNHSYMLYQFRRELIKKLMEKNDVVLAMPFVGRVEELQKMVTKCIKTDMDRRGINPFTDFGLLKTYIKMIKEEKPDLVITYSIKPNIYAGLICKSRKIPYAANVQGLGTAFEGKVLAAFVSLLYKMAFRKVKVVFFENEGNAEEFRKRNIIPREKEVVLKGAGVNLEHYAYQEYPESDDVVHFLFLGRIMKEKGVDELFASMRKLRKEYGEKVVLDIVGFFEDDYENTVKQLVREGIAVFEDFKDDPRPCYGTAHCVVLPSYHEGMSNVLLEAAASGRPVITCDIPGCREAVEDGKTGYLCKVKDKQSLYEQMKKFMLVSSDVKEEMGKSGREKIAREFDKNMVVEMTRRELAR